jgi:hypothetical protein
VIDVRAIRKDHISKGALVLVVTMGLAHDFFAEGKVSDSILGFLPVGLAFLWAVDAAKADAVSMVAFQDFNGIAVEYGYDIPGEGVGK